MTSVYCGPASDASIAALAPDDYLAEISMREGLAFFVASSCSTFENYVSAAGRWRTIVDQTNTPFDCPDSTCDGSGILYTSTGPSSRSESPCTCRTSGRRTRFEFSEPEQVDWTWPEIVAIRWITPGDQP